MCDRENLEILLRMARRARQPSFKPLKMERLNLFLASWQGLVNRGEDTEDLQDRLDQLFGFPAPADAWEKQILPARMAPYYCSWLDSLMQGSGLRWFGCGAKKLAFAFADDLELFLGRPGGTGAEPAECDAAPDAVSQLFPRKIGSYSLADIVRFSKSDSRAVTRRLWELAWKGLVNNDTFAAVRQGILTAFVPPSFRSDRHRSLKPGRGRWSMPQPFPGSWRALGLENVERDSIDEFELVKDRVRQLLNRYGILFRQLLSYEQPLLQWGSIFRALRLMEFLGEILSGHFFEGIPGIQFISHEAFRFLNEPLPEDRVFWMNAADPASLCGMKLDSLKGVLPSRIPSTHLVYQGERLVLISRRNGRVLTFRFSSDDLRVPEYLSFFKVLLSREFSPEKVITVETINGKQAQQSEFAGPLREFGFSGGYKGLELVKRY